ncbi:hypothetical protein, partial [Burkholderia multivorans]|uniref:hypothetical protein n=1 Tax=Burkholderia multivorans TaxID=87883 RepID=UPI0021BF357D
LLLDGLIIAFSPQHIDRKPLSLTITTREDIARQLTSDPRNGETLRSYLSMPLPRTRSTCQPVTSRCRFIAASGDGKPPFDL